MMSVSHRFLIDAAKLRVLLNEKVGRILTRMEEIGAGRGRGLP
jgi:hypothetical protein